MNPVMALVTGLKPPPRTSSLPGSCLGYSQEALTYEQAAKLAENILNLEGMSAGDTYVWSVSVSGPDLLAYALADAARARGVFFEARVIGARS